MQVRKKIFFLPFKVRNKVAANALSPLVFLLQLKFEVLEKNVLQQMDAKKGRQWAQKNQESVEAFWENRENLKSLTTQMLLAWQEIFYAKRFPGRVICFLWLMGRKL